MFSIKSKPSLASWPINRFSALVVFRGDDDVSTGGTFDSSLRVVEPRTISRNARVDLDVNAGNEVVLTRFPVFMANAAASLDVAVDVFVITVDVVVVDTFCSRVVSPRKPQKLIHYL